MNAANLAQALGGHRTGGQFLAKCPCHLDRSPSLAIRDGQLGPLLFCHAGCSTRDVIDELRGRGLWGDRDHRYRAVARLRPAARAASDVERSGYAQSIWNAARNPRGTLAEKYLNGRGLELDEDLCDRVLRFHPCCPFGERTSVPALVAAFRPIRNTDDDAPQAIHRIGLTPDGRKIEKKMLGPVSGCAVKLDADDQVELGLGITEGLETGMAVRATGWRPVWALGSAGTIKMLAPVPGIEALTIFADHDPTGLGAGQACAERWQAAGREAFIRWPKGLGRDYADEAGR